MGHILDELSHPRSLPPVVGSQPQGSRPLGPPTVPDHGHDYVLPNGTDLASLIQKLQTRALWVLNAMLVGPIQTTFATVEKNLTMPSAMGPGPRRSGTFSITGLSGLTVGKQVLVTKAIGPYTGKGARADEAEMDQIDAQGTVVSPTQIDVYWQSKTYVQGNHKFNYAVGG